MKYTKNSSGYDCKKILPTGYKKEAEEMREKILRTENTEEIYDISGKKYYITKDMSVKDIPQNLNPGDAVLFQRGGLWRIGDNEDFSVPKGVIFGAYGEGDKPKFYGSKKNYAHNSLWEKEGNLWKIIMHGGNVGIITFDEEAILGVKKWSLEEVTENFDFFHNMENGYLYLYFDGDLEKEFSSIEIGQRGDVIRLNSGSVVDNFCVRHTGSHGIVIGGKTQDFYVTNCEVGFIGGSHQFGTTRFGNGIEMQLGVKNAHITGNWVYQCYDAGITFQTWSSAKMDTYYHDIDMNYNLVEYCYYGFEFFSTDPDTDGLYSEYKNISFIGNVFRFSALGWSYEQRPDHWMGAHIRSGQFSYIKLIENFKIQKNVFDVARTNIVFWWWDDPNRNYSHPEKEQGIIVNDNVYIQAPTFDKRCMTFHHEPPCYAENLDEFKVAVASFDEKPAKLVWLDK